MDSRGQLYQTCFNPLLIEPERGLPRSFAVVGAGTIGPDIGYYLKSALPESSLFLVDIADEPLERARKRLEAYAKKAVDRRKMKKEKAGALLEGIVYTKDYGQLAECGLVIEAATENIALKQKIFAGLEEVLSEEAVITSNTSSIPADRIFSGMKRKGRATITHFFAPAWRSLPVELINWEGVDRDVLGFLFWFFAVTGKVPIMTDNVICFMLDRVFDNWCNEAALLLENASAAQVDHAVEDLVYAGPFFVLNMARGNPIIIETNTLQMEEGPHYRPARILESVDLWLTGRPGSQVEIPEDVKNSIRRRMLGILFSQSFDIIDRNIGTKSDLNLGCQIALGFKKGPLDLMKELGEGQVRETMDAFESQRPGFPTASSSFSDYQGFYRHLLLDEMDGVKIITIRRPQAMNALNDEVTAEILSVLREYEKDPSTRGFVITGYGERAFSAGADIGKFPEMLGDRERSIEYSRSCAGVQRFMDGMSKPVVAAINGLALGGGLEVAIRCHSMVATRNARFQFPEITLGIIPGIGGCIVPYRKWPKGAALFNEMITLARSLSVEETSEIGMVAAVADTYRENVLAAIEEVKRLEGNIERIPEGAVDIPEFEIPDNPMAGRLALSREAVSLAVKTVRAGAAAGGLEEALEIGYAGFGDIACTDAAREGITAFLEKRKPVYDK